MLDIFLTFSLCILICVVLHLYHVRKHRLEVLAEIRETMIQILDDGGFIRDYHPLTGQPFYNTDISNGGSFCSYAGYDLINSISNIELMLGLKSSKPTLCCINGNIADEKMCAWCECQLILKRR